eukprot:scaffold2527_cov337-Prasinococcus_capsulatus_cf.AAC.4
MTLALTEFEALCQFVTGEELKVPIYVLLAVSEAAAVVLIMDCLLVSGLAGRSRYGPRVTDCSRRARVRGILRGAHVQSRLGRLRPAAATSAAHCVTADWADARVCLLLFVVQRPSAA